MAFNVVKISDLNVAAMLETKGFHVLQIERTQPDKRGVFIFVENPLIPEMVAKYWSGELEGNMKDFARAIKELKSRLYANDGVGK